jgi:aconitate hydratase
MSQAGIIEKILRSHLVKGKFTSGFASGEEIAVRVDQTLTQDATGTMVYLEFEAMGVSKIKTNLSVSYVDHNTIQDGFENADDHKYLQAIASKYGILYSKAGNGVCHQVHLERFAKPGEILLGSDSHTPTAGGIGSLGIGVGGLDVALAMSGEPFHLTCPKIVKIDLHGKLPLWSSAKDVILTILKLLGTKGNVGVMIEYGGKGVQSLSIPERATITNMGAELGVTSSVFPSDKRTLQFLKAQGRRKDWTELAADNKAEYEKVIDVDLNKIVPMAAQPHSPDNVCTARKIAGRKVNQVCIGSCTNSSYKDLMLVAGLLKNKKIHPEVSLVVTPGSRQVLKMIADSGALSNLINAGARVTEPCCGFCIGNSHAPQTDGVSIRTINRNFYGRSGTKTAQVYLTSPETAVACAIKGVITDPRDLGENYPRITTPEKFVVDESMILKPSRSPEKVKIYRGPNIGDPPKNTPLPESIKGRVSIKVGDKVTTDHIMPAGSRLKYRSNIKKYAEYVFEPVDSSFSSRCLENKKKGIDNISGDSKII